MPIALAILLAGSGFGLYHYRLPLLHGVAEPPVPVFEDLERPLAARLRERLEVVRAEPYSAAAWGSLARAYDVHRLYAQAIPCYERAQELDREDWQWPYLLGLCTRLGDTRASLAHFQRARALQDEYAPTHFYIGNALLESGEHERARASFARALELEPKMIPACLGLARVALAEDDLDGALELLERALRMGPKTGEAQTLLTEVFRRKGQTEALERLAGLEFDRLGVEPVGDPMRQALEMEEGITLEWRRRRSEFYFETNRTEQAVAEWQTAVAEDPESAQAHTELGRAYVRSGRPEQALRSCEHAIDLDPDAAQAHLGLADALRLLGQNDRAIESYRRALELDPGLQDGRNSLGVLLVSAGRADEGLPLIEESCQSMPDNAEALYNYAMALKSAGRRAEAAATLEAVLELDPDLSQALLETGLQLALDGQLEEALVRVRRASAGLPQILHSGLLEALESHGREDATAHLEVAAALIRMNRLPSAEAFLARALELDPEHERARFDHGMVLARSGRLEDAAGEFRRVVSADPTRRPAQVNLVRALISQDRFAEAVEATREALVHLPGDEELTAVLAWTLATCPAAEVRNGPEALELARGICEGSGYSDPNSLGILAAACAETGDFAAAVDRAEQASELLSAGSPVDEVLGKTLRSCLESYRRGQPYYVSSR